MRIQDIDDSKASERKYWALTVVKGLRETADSLAQQFGTRPQPATHDDVAFPLVRLAHGAGDDRYCDVLEAVPDALVVMTPDGEIVLLNVQAEQEFGFRRDELLGKPFESIVRGAVDRLVSEPDGVVEAGRAVRQLGMGIEFSARRKDGSEFPVEVMLGPVKTGNRVLVTAVIRNISARKAVQKHLVEMEVRYRDLLEAAPDAIVVVNRRGRIVLVNALAERQFGYDRAELVARSAKDIIPEGFAERLVGNDTQTVREALALQVGVGIELYGRRKDGSEFPIEIMLSPLDSAQGMLVTAAVRDITVRKGAERQLARMEAYHRALLEASPDAMVVANPAGEIVLVNAEAEKKFGYRRDELIGRKVTAIVPAGLEERLAGGILQSAEHKLAQSAGGIELSGRRKDGSDFPLEVMLGSVDSVDGLMVAVAVRDISARKRAEANLLQKIRELDRSNEDLEQFAYLASHDLQEPLRTIVGYTQLLTQRYRGRLDADADEFLAFAADGASRLQQLVQDLLTYSRVGSRGSHLADTSSEGALMQALLNLQHAIKDSGAIVTHDPLPTIVADEVQLVRLFQNIVGNAAKYQTDGVPRIHVSASLVEGWHWVFSVQDNGIGIEPQHFETIFGMFRRLHPWDEFPGSGIGLAICHKIVEQNGGGISVESEPGRGSTFRFALTGGQAVVTMEQADSKGQPRPPSC